ncbi:GNAT family N-acetyltransferase [Nocardia sp. CDC159]|uniref:GNAT family N-acetyltransferase n=1 Tax=Nocardia pulmonis TaxID=2951408 RepID=A0A9X2EBT0_9NOCA|nr:MULTISPECIES: GNAT family N-acetyltransferase [Nocardia]MCM6777395.1 GNAT family N-acetyltransferase [Nocardia pulmonis]MCM6790280.1 GNAT family N-acetyltransferase [Nocardia sp. CDC159]
MTSEIPSGRRVVVRYRLPAGHSHEFTDVIGELIGHDPLTVRTRDGHTVTVDADAIVAVKALGPRPIRTTEIRALEAAACDGWPGVERVRLDGWLLSAGNGYTNRANSAVPVGISGEPARLHVDTLRGIAAWYAERGLPPRLRLPDRLAPVPPGWRTWSETAVLGIDIGNFVLPQGPSMVRVEAEPNRSWLDLHRFRGEDVVDLPPPLPDTAVLTAVHEGELGFATLGLPDPLAIGRGALTTAPDGRRWIGLSCVAVAAPHRRHGLGTLVCAELIRWGHRHGATHAYVQVEADNAAALGLYREMGFIEHHHYRYATPA